MNNEEMLAHAEELDRRGIAILLEPYGRELEFQALLERSNFEHEKARACRLSAVCADPSLLRRVTDRLAVKAAERDAADDDALADMFRDELADLIAEFTRLS